MTSMQYPGQSEIVPRDDAVGHHSECNVLKHFDDTQHPLTPQNTFAPCTLVYDMGNSLTHIIEENLTR